MALDVKKLADDMTGKMTDKLKPVLGQRMNEVQQYVKEEAGKLVEVLAKIETEKRQGSISEQQANILFDMQKNAFKAVLAAVKGFGEMAAREALMAALETVLEELKEPINNALGFKLL